MKLKVKQTVKQPRNWRRRSGEERGHCEAKNHWQRLDLNQQAMYNAHELWSG